LLEDIVNNSKEVSTNLGFCSSNV